MIKPISSPTPSHPSPSYPGITGWIGKYVQELRAPLSSAWYSPQGFIDIAWRIRLLFGLVLLVLVGYYAVRRWTTQPPPPETPRKPPTIARASPTTHSNFPGQPSHSVIVSPMSPPRRRLEPLLKSPLTEASQATLDESQPPQLDEQKIQEDIKEILHAFEEIVNNLHQLPERIETFESQCQAFIDTYSNFEAEPLYQRCFKLLDSVMIRLYYLNNNYELLLTHCIAGREDHLFRALLWGGIFDYCQKKRDRWPLEEKMPKTVEKLRPILIKEMKKRIAHDQELQSWTNSAIEAATIVLEVSHLCKIDRFLDQLDSEERDLPEFNRQLAEQTRKIASLKHCTATATYPDYFDLLEQKMLKFGSINTIYVFSQLFPDIKVQISGFDQPFNPDGSFTLAIELGDERQFVYKRAAPEPSPPVEEEPIEAELVDEEELVLDDD